MPTNYPGALDTIGSTLPDNKANSTLTVDDHASHHNNLADAVIAVETVLGTSPAGSYTTVAAAILNKVDLSPSTAQVILPTADVVGLTIKQHNAADVSNIFETRLSTNALAAYIDKTGAFSAQALKIAGTALAASHLSNGVSGTGAVVLASAISGLAPLASPTFTGTPAAPTPATGDNSTTIATTAFVKAQAYATLASPALTGTPTAPTAGSGDNSTQIATTAFVTTAVNSATALTINSQTLTSYTPVLSDAGKMIDFSNASAITLTVPPNSSVAFPVGTQINLLQSGAGQVTVAAGAGVTINANPGLKLNGQWASATLVKRATDTWVLIGNLTT